MRRLCVTIIAGWARLCNPLLVHLQGFSKVAFSAATQRPYGCHFDQREKSLSCHRRTAGEISPRRLVEMTKFIDF
jgi:hypothetical protein